MISMMNTISKSRNKRVRKRVLTEARREQNRLNQRAYRQRRRAAQPHQGLESCSESSSALRVEQHGRWPTISDERDDASIAQDIDHALRGLEPLRRTGTRKSNASPPDQHNHTHQVTENDHINEILSGWPSDNLPSLADVMNLGKPSIPFNPELTVPSCHGTPAHDESATANVSNSASDQDRLFQIVRETSDLREASAALPDSCSSQVLLTSSTGATIEGHTTIEPANVQYDPITVEGFEISTVIAAGVAMLLGKSNSQQNIAPPCQLPDPWTGCIHFSRTHMLLACIYNARSMGLNLQELLMGSQLAPSPFHRPTTPADDPKRLLAAITSPTTPAHLKPTLPQILYPHPAFMDLIPIPAFRTRAITLLATQPHLIDVQELKNDVAVQNGLCYWSSGSHNHSRSGVTGAAQGQPWDMRSWEVEPWFLRKWRMLFNGEDGDIWKQSMWWQKAREESTPNHSAEDAFTLSE